MLWSLLVAIVLVMVIGMYNGLVSLKVQADNAWADTTKRKLKTCFPAL